MATSSAATVPRRPRVSTAPNSHTGMSADALAKHLADKGAGEGADKLAAALEAAHPGVSPVRCPLAADTRTQTRAEGAASHRTGLPGFRTRPANPRCAPSHAHALPPDPNHPPFPPPALFTLPLTPTRTTSTRCAPRPAHCSPPSGSRRSSAAPASRRSPRARSARASLRCSACWAARRQRRSRRLAKRRTCCYMTASSWPQRRVGGGLWRGGAVAHAVRASAGRAGARRGCMPRPQHRFVSGRSRHASRADATPPHSRHPGGSPAGGAWPRPR